MASCGIFIALRARLRLFGLVHALRFVRIRAALFTVAKVCWQKRDPNRAELSLRH